MIGSVVREIWLTISHVFGNMNTVDGIIAIAVVLIFGIAMKRLPTLLTYTFLALGCYVVATYLVSVGQGTPFDIAVQQLWSETDYVTLRTFLTYFVSFSLVIGSIFLLKLGVTKSG